MNEREIFLMRNGRNELVIGEIPCYRNEESVEQQKMAFERNVCYEQI